MIRAVAARAKVREIIAVSVLDVRGHFISQRGLKRDEAKRAVANMCRVLGWEAADSNAADALALWSYACASVHPARALDVTPLFGSWDAVAKAREAKR